MIFRVVCTNNNRAKDHLSEGEHYYVSTTLHPTWMSGVRTPGYRMISPEVLEELRNGSSSEKDHVRSATRFQIVPAELCEKYNHVNILQGIKQALKKRGQEF